jgi:NDP-sugar pyrophosphorylase family protein
MQAVILAGGLGTRLRSIIGDLPKPLAPVQGRPFLEFQIEHLASEGFTRILLCVGHRYDLIRAHLHDGAAYGVEIAYSVEEEPLGTAGALRHARPYLDNIFLALNGDTFFTADLSSLVTAHQAGGTCSTVALVQVPEAGRFGQVALDANGYVTHFNEKGNSGPGLINAGVYVFSSAVFDYFPAQTPLSLENQVFPVLARQRLLRGQVHHGYHIDIGTPESYARFQADMASAHRPGVLNSM